MARALLFEKDWRLTVDPIVVERRPSVGRYPAVARLEAAVEPRLVGNSAVEQQEVEQPFADSSAAEQVEQPSADSSAAAQVVGVALADNSVVAEQTKVEQPFVGKSEAAEPVERRLLVVEMQLLFVQATGTGAGTVAGFAATRMMATALLPWAAA